MKLSVVAFNCAIVPDDEMRLEIVVEASTVWPSTVSEVAEALVSVVLPVTSNVEENTPVVPVIAPRLASDE